jgi:ornithine carbamoyltransferase
LREDLQDWRVDDPWFATTRPDCRLMHCLPVRRGVAVTDRVLDGPRSAVVHEAQNRMWAQMAVLYQMMGPGV